MNLPEDDELLKTPKEELERIKLALEIAAFQDDRKQVKRKSWGETSRLAIMAIFTAVISLGSTFLMKVYDHGTTQNDDARKELATFKKQYASTLNLHLRDSVACEIGQIDVPENNRKIQDTVDYYRSICHKNQQLNKDIAVKQDTIKHTNQRVNQKDPKTIVAVNNLINDDEKLMKLQAQLNSKNAGAQVEAQKKIEDLTNSSKASAPPELKSAIQSSTDINKTVTTQIAAVSTNPTGDSHDKIYPVYWVKKGYYILFDQFKVYLSDLQPDKGTAQVTICYNIDDSHCDPAPLPDNGVFSIQKALDFKYNGTSYSLVLQRIDHAGVNPFKQAAYMNLVQKVN